VRYINSADRHRTVCRDYLGGAADGTDRPCAHRRVRRASGRLRELNWLRISLRRRYGPILCVVVWRYDCSVYVCRLEARPDASAVVSTLRSTSCVSNGASIQHTSRCALSRCNGHGHPRIVPLVARPSIRAQCASALGLQPPVKWQLHLGAVVSAARNANPTLDRRAKIIARLEEQKLLLKDQNHNRTVRNWVRKDGE